MRHNACKHAGKMVYVLNHIKLFCCIALAFMISADLYAQSPGGVSGGLRNGISFEFYDGYDPTPANGITGTLLSTGYVDNLNNPDDIFLDERVDNFSVVFNTLINIPVAGSYVFRMEGLDDVAAMFINGALYLDGPCCGTATGVPISLTAGFHTIRVNYSELNGFEHLNLEWDVPGGVTTFETIPDSLFFTNTTLSAWYKANDGITDANATTVTTWPDHSGKSNNLSVVSGNPMYADNAGSVLNYNPFVIFSDDMMSPGDHVNGFAWDKHSRTTFIVSRNTDVGDQIMMGYGKDAFNEAYAVGTVNQNMFNTYWGNVPGVHLFEGAGKQFEVGRSYISNFQYVNSNIQSLNNITGSVNGVPSLQGTKTNVTTFLNNNEDLGIGASPDFGSGAGATTTIAEVIFYPWKLDATEINKVESYLAVKYGVALNQDIQTNYTASDGTVIWDATSNLGYSHDIFGIARDTTSALDQRISTSVNQRTVLTVALDNDFLSSNGDVSRTTEHTNTLQYLMFSNNGFGLAVNQSSELPSGTHYNLRLPREWRVSKTANFGESVNLKFQGFGSTSVQQYYLFKDSDGDFSSGAVEVGVLDANGEITGVSFNDGEYFTLVSYKPIPGGISGGVHNGLYFEFYDRYDAVLADGIAGNLLSSGYLSNLNGVNTVFTDERSDEFSLKITSDLNITTAGDYTFRLVTPDDVASIYIDGSLYLNGCCLTDATGTPITLSAGLHSIEVRYSQENSVSYLDVEWDLPGGGVSFVEIPDSQFFVPVSMSMWCKADEGVLSVNDVVSFWGDVSGNSGTLTPELGQVIYNQDTGLLNFNPYVNFTDDQMSTGDHLKGFGWDKQSRTSFIVSVQPATGVENMMGYGRYAANGNYYLGSFNENLIIGTFGTFSTSSGTPYADAGIYLARAGYENSNIQGTNNVTGALNGTSQISVTNSNIRTELNANEDFGLGNAPDYPLNNGVITKIAEALHFPWDLNSTEIDQVESYLALKYGVTLDQSTPRNYVASDGTVYWNAASNVGYTNDIFGIGIDTLSALNQKISQSSRADGVVVMALDHNFTVSNINAARTTTHANNMQFLMLSNNGESKAKNNILELPGGLTTYDARIAREWRVTKTANFGQNVSLRFKTFNSTDAVKFTLMKDADGDFSTGATEVGLLDDKGEISGVTLADGEYLTLFITHHTPGAVKGGLKNGVAFDFYNGYDPTLTDGITAPLKSYGYISNLNEVQNIFLNEQTDQFSLKLTTRLNILVAGDYIFRLNGIDDKGAIYIDNTLYLDASCCGDVTGVPINLTAGYHDIEIRYSEDGGGERLDVQWDIPGGGITFENIPDNQLFTNVFMSGWYKTDDGIPDDSASALTSWIDNSLNDNILAVDFGTPTYYTGISDNRIMNFNPIVAIDDDLLSPGDDINGYPWEQQSRTVFAVSSQSANAKGIITGYGENEANRNFNIGSYAYNLAIDFHDYFYQGTGGQYLNTGTYLNSNQYINSNISGANNVLGWLNSSPEIAETKLDADTRLNNNQDFLIGNSPDYSISDGFDGWLGEVIYFPWELSAAEINRVESYLGVKYGISLDQATPKNYVASDGSIVWDATNNVGYTHDIFAVGRDSLSVLDQKVSRSAGQDDVLILSLNGDFVSPNIDTNRTKHENSLQFLFLSNNDGGTTTDQTTEMPSAPIREYDFRMGREWRVTKTANFTQTVNLKFDGYGSSRIVKNYVLKDSDGDFTNGATEVGLLNARGEITGITLADGEYLTIVSHKASPGGVSNALQIWTMANDNGAASDQDHESLTTDGATMTQGWTNWYGGDFEIAAGTPTYESDSASQMNFNPTINFDGLSYFRNLTSNFGLTGLESELYSVIRSFNSTTPFNNNHSFFGPSAMFFNAMEAYVNAPTQQLVITAHGSSTELTNQTINTAEGNILGVSRAGNGVGSTHVNGLTRINTGVSDLTPWESTSRYYIGAAHATGILNGNMPEVVLYNRELTGVERQKVSSYLAIKYGVPIQDLSSVGQTEQYLASDGTVIWDETLVGTGYVSNVFGIGRDDRSALNQVISKPFRDDAALIMSAEDNYTSINSERGDSVITTNLNFVMVGSNADPLAWQTTEICACEGQARVGREWQMQVTGSDIQYVYLAIHKDKLPAYPSNVGFYIVESDDGDFSQGNNSPYEMHLSGEYYRAKVPVKNGTYFTLAYVDKNYRLRNGKKFVFGKLVYPTTK